jgi:hypothetical protein
MSFGIHDTQVSLRCGISPLSCLAESAGRLRIMLRAAQTLRIQECEIDLRGFIVVVSGQSVPMPRLRKLLPQTMSQVFFYELSEIP